VRSINCLGLEPRLIGKVAATLSVMNMVLSFKEAGLGNGNITSVCVNPGGQCPNAANKKTVTAERPAEATFRPENGHVTASLMLIPPPRRISAQVARRSSYLRSALRTCR